MATVLSQYSATGFHKATVCKGLLGGIFLTSTIVNVPMYSHLQKYLHCDTKSIFQDGQFWRLFVSRLAFPNAKEIFCCAVLIYYFRVFERRFGSQKFASFLLATSTISTLLELFLVHFLRSWVPHLMDKPGVLAPGPYSLVFPLFVYFWGEIPREAQTSIMGIPITAKTLTYLLGFQVAASSMNTAVGAFCGLLAGVLYKYDVLGVKTWLKVPKALANFFDVTLSKLIESSPPQASALPAGATLEIQRQQLMDQLEQQMILSRQQEVNVRAFDFPRAAPPVSAEPVAPIQEYVTSLVDMGFSRDRAVRALQRANNDMEVATNILLQEPDSVNER